MTQDEIIRMAREAGGYLAELPNGDAWLFNDNQQIERFADLVAAHEREKMENQVKPTVWKNTIDEVRFKEPVNSCQKSTELVGIEAAVLAEREACAKMCEEGTALTAFQSKDCYSYARNRAAAIRARGN